MVAVLPRAKALGTNCERESKKSVLSARLYDADENEHDWLF